jgi:hypothetical protein
MMMLLSGKKAFISLGEGQSFGEKGMTSGVSKVVDVWCMHAFFVPEKKRSYSSGQRAGLLRCQRHPMCHFNHLYAFLVSEQEMHCRIWFRDKYSVCVKLQFFLSF